MYKEMEKTRKPEDDNEIYSKRYAELPLNYHPGEEWQYSGATTIVGRLVEVMSGMTLDEFFKKRIFQPLGMKDTHFYLPESKLDRFVVAYKPSTDKKNIEMIDPASSESRFVKPPHAFFRGSGGLVSTASDYFLFCQMMLNGGELNGARILGRKTVEFMTQNHIGDLVPWLTGEGSGFGLGFSVQMNLDHTNILTPSYWQQIPVIGSVGSYGWGGAYCTIFRIDPAEELIIIMMSQVRPYTHLNIRNNAFVLAYQAIID
jgi:CubicO group peptidase (beta-lactamase class C family)